MNTITDKKLTGGMFASKGFLQQDLASIKYIFSYLDNGLQEISFESDDDFCLVVNSKKINVQVKSNTLNLSSLKAIFNSILAKEPKADQNIIITSGYDKKICSMIDHRNRFINQINAIYHAENKDPILSDWKSYCENNQIDPNLMSECIFDTMDTINSRSIARDAIGQWAEKEKIYIDTNALMEKFMTIIPVKRSESGNLSIQEIQNIIFNFRCGSRMTIDNEASINLKLIIKYIEGIINKNLHYEESLLLIKHDIEHRRFANAENKVYDYLQKNIPITNLRNLHLWLLNTLGKYLYIIKNESQYYKDDIFCYFEFARAYYSAGKWNETREYIDKIDKKLWHEQIYILSAKSYHKLKQDDKSQQELLDCLNIHTSCVDALEMIGTLTSKNDPKKATEYFQKILTIDKNNFKAYYGLAEISKNKNDFTTALKYYHKSWIAIKHPEKIPNELMAKIAILTYICEKDSWELYFQKWHDLFRKQENPSNEKIITLPEQEYVFKLISKEDNFTIICNDEPIFKYPNKNIAISSIGTCPFLKDICFNELLSQTHSNPIRSTPEYIYEHSSYPIIIRDYNTLECYNDTLSKLQNTDKLILNHQFTDKTQEYIINDNDIAITLEVRHSEIIGNIMIDDVTMRIWINSIGEGFQKFKKQLSEDNHCDEAYLILRHNDEIFTQLNFKKKVIKIVDIL